MDTLIVLCAGNDNYKLNGHWYQPISENKSHDLFVCFYGDNSDTMELYKKNSDYFIEKKGPKWQLIRYVFNNNKEFFKKYKYVWLPDDDLYMTSYDVQRFFQTLKTYDYIDISQPSLIPINASTDSLVAQHYNELPIHKSWIEIQAPCFKMDIFERIFPAIDQDYCKCGWGLDCMWSDIGIFNTYVIDSCIMFHTRPSNCNSGFYQLYNINTFEEKERNMNYLKSILLQNK